MSSPDREIPQRELRNDIGRVLKDVASGARLRVTVGGKPVADLIPIRPGRRFVPLADLRSILENAPLDPGFPDDVASVAGGTIEEL